MDLGEHPCPNDFQRQQVEPGNEGQRGDDRTGNVRFTVHRGEGFPASLRFILLQRIRCHSLEVRFP